MKKGKKAKSQAPAVYKMPTKKTGLLSVGAVAAGYVASRLSEGALGFIPSDTKNWVRVAGTLGGMVSAAATKNVILQSASAGFALHHAGVLVDGLITSILPPNDGSTMNQFLADAFGESTPQISEQLAYARLNSAIDPMSNFSLANASVDNYEQETNYALA